jgi:two-component system CheB/CheR fusion protein
VADLVSKIRHDRLLDDAQEVLRTLVPKEAEVPGDNNTWYLMRVLPYRTVDNVIDGLVMTFVDITETKKAQYLANAIVQTVQHPLLVLDAEDRIVAANRTFCSTFDGHIETLRGSTLTAIGDGPWTNPDLRDLLRELFASSATHLEADVSHRQQGGEEVTWHVRADRMTVAGSTTAGYTLLVFEAPRTQEAR